MRDQLHRVTVRVGAHVVEKWSDYTIRIDMLTAADDFRLTLGRPDRQAFQLCAPDTPLQVLLDETVLITGFIDDREWSIDRAGPQLAISGRDKAGRLVDESAPLLSYVGLGIQQLAEKVSAPWFTKVSLQNTRNRRLLRGKTAPAIRASSEPPIRTTARADKKVSPGESRWQVLSSFLQEADLLAWSAADGQELIVGLPNYDQEPGLRFVLTKPGSDRRDEGNLLAYALADSTAERYSKVIACGAGRGDSANYSERVTKRRAVALNGPGKDGIGRDFSARKVLLVSDDDIRNEDQARVRAEREMAERDSTGRRLTLKVRGHSQRLADGSQVIYAPDTMAMVEDEIMGLAGLWLVTGVTFTHNRQDGETSKLELVPQGTRLRS